MLGHLTILTLGHSVLELFTSLRTRICITGELEKSTAA